MVKSIQRYVYNWLVIDVNQFIFEKYIRVNALA